MALVSGGSARDPLASSVATLVLNKGQERPIFVWRIFIKVMGFFLLYQIKLEESNKLGIFFSNVRMQQTKKSIGPILFLE